MRCSKYGAENPHRAKFWVVCASPFSPIFFPVDRSLYALNSSSNALAFFRSAVSKPSVNQL